MRVEIGNTDETFQYLDGLSEERAEQAIGIITQDVYENVKRLAGRHNVTGVMERNVTHKVKSMAGTVYIDDRDMMVQWRGRPINYAFFVLYGTQPHEIKPKNKKALRFDTLGGFVFSKTVHHPGYAGDDFLTAGMQETFQNLGRLLDGF